VIAHTHAPPWPVSRCLRLPQAAGKTPSLMLPSVTGFSTTFPSDESLNLGLDGDMFGPPVLLFVPPIREVSGQLPVG
jgi:hypothetical protein